MSNSIADLTVGSRTRPVTCHRRRTARFSSLRGDFVFLDAPGGTQTPDEVAAAVAQVYRESSGNTGAPYATSRRLEALVDEARAASARFLGCTFDEVIFGANMTSLNFTLSRTLGRQLDPGDEIVVTRLDHDANVAPWLDLAADRDLRVRHADVHADTSLDLADLERQLGPRTKVVAFPWAANSTGTIVDARAICDLAHQAGALAWVDAVQYAAHEPMDVHVDRRRRRDLLGLQVLRAPPGHRVRPPGAARVVAALQGTAGRRSSRSGTGSRPEPCRTSCSAACSRPTPTSTAWAEWRNWRAWERQLGERMLAGFPPARRCTACRPWRAGCRRS